MWGIKTVDVIAKEHKAEKKKQSLQFLTRAPHTHTNLKLYRYDPFLKSFYHFQLAPSQEARLHHINLWGTLRIRRTGQLIYLSLANFSKRSNKDVFIDVQSRRLLVLSNELQHNKVM